MGEWLPGMGEWLPGMGVWLPGMPGQSPPLLPHSLFSTSFFDWWLVAPLKIKTHERMCQKHSYSLSHQRKESRANWRSAVVERPKKIRKKENVLNGECPWNREKKALAGPLCVCHMETVCRHSGAGPHNPPVPGDHRDGGMRPPSWWEPSSPDIRRKGQLRTYSEAEARRPK